MNHRGNNATSSGPQPSGSPPSKSPDTAVHWTDRVLSGADQRAVIVLSLFGILAMAAWWVGHGGCRGNVIEIDHADVPIEAQYLIDVNTADWNELVQLPGIGPTYASRIVESRQNEGPFKTHEDLLRVHGIGPKRLEKMRPFLAPIEPPPSK